MPVSSLSCFVPLFQNESLFNIFHTIISFICMEMQLLAETFISMVSHNSKACFDTDSEMAYSMKSILNLLALL